jgi:predicted transcriptional regulator
MSQASLLKKRTRKVVTLAQTDDEGNPITVVIRKVMAGQVTARAGAPLSIITALREGDPNETMEQRKERLRATALEDPERIREMADYGQRLRQAVVSLGVVSLKVVDKPEAELEEDEILPDHFGEDFATLYNAILQFSDLPFSPVEVRDATAFRPEQVAEPVLGNGEGAGH